MFCNRGPITRLHTLSPRSEVFGLSEAKNHASPSVGSGWVCHHCSSPIHVWGDKATCRTERDVFGESSSPLYVPSWSAAHSTVSSRDGNEFLTKKLANSRRLVLFTLLKYVER